MIVIVCEPLIRKWINSHKIDPETGSVPPEAMVCVVCLAAILIPAGEIIFAWTCTPNVHYIAPILAGIPFGAGNAAVFIYASNYLVSSYDIYAASALAGNAVLRSAMGATLPLAGPSMYKALGAHWAGTLLGLLEVRTLLSRGISTLRTGSFADLSCNRRSAFPSHSSSTSTATG